MNLDASEVQPVIRRLLGSNLFLHIVARGSLLTWFLTVTVDIHPNKATVANHHHSNTTKAHW